jgi:hypothetical protein
VCNQKEADLVDQQSQYALPDALIDAILVKVAGAIAGTVQFIQKKVLLHSMILLKFTTKIHILKK